MPAIAANVFALFFAAASHTPGAVVALGVGAPASNEITVKIEGQDRRVKLAGVEAGSDAARLFLQCLIGKHVVRVDAKRGRAWTLDDVEVNRRVREFLANPPSLDPCEAARTTSTAPAEPLPRVQRKRGT